jgi:hypothetical protein
MTLSNLSSRHVCFGMEVYALENEQHVTWISIRHFQFVNTLRNDFRTLWLLVIYVAALVLLVSYTHKNSVNLNYWLAVSAPMFVILTFVVFGELLRVEVNTVTLRMGY